MTWDSFGSWFADYQREVAAETDIRNAQAFPGAIVASGATVTLGDNAKPADRTVGVPTLFSRIANTGKATDQRFLPSVSVVNWLSAQSADPLTSTSTATESTINIAAYTVRYGAGTVSYGAGSITGLSVDTVYYVYAEDADLEGGAVAYTASTDPLDVVAGNSRVRVGVIRTGKSAATANVTAATQANPCAITTGAAHGFDSGDTVTFADVGGMTELNSLPATAITVTGPDSFTLNGVNSAAYGAYTTGGTVVRANTDGTGGGGWPWSGEIPEGTVIP